MMGFGIQLHALVKCNMPFGSSWSVLCYRSRAQVIQSRVLTREGSVAARRSDYVDGYAWAPSLAAEVVTTAPRTSKTRVDLKYP